MFLSKHVFYWQALSHLSYVPLFDGFEGCPKIELGSKTFSEFLYLTLLCATTIHAALRLSPDHPIFNLQGTISYVKDLIIYIH